MSSSASGLVSSPCSQRAADRAFDILSHRVKTQRIRVFAKNCGLLLAVFAGEIEIDRRVAPGPLIGDFLRAFEGVEQLQRDPGMLS